MTVKPFAIVSGFWLSYAAFVIMPPGPWYRELGAALLAGFSCLLFDWSITKRPTR